MKRNIVPLLGIAFVVAIVSTGVFYGLFAGRLRSSVPEMSTRGVVVAARNLERGAVLQTADLRVAQLPASGLKESYAKPEEVVGQTVVESVKEGEPITPGRLVSGQAGAGSVPAGLRAVSVRVSESSGVVALLKPGVRVDVQAVSRRENSAELKTIVQNVQVLWVSPQTDAAANQGIPTVVTLLARAQDADALALADSAAKIRVALRNPSDGDAPPRRSLALAAVFSSSPESSFAPPHGADAPAARVVSYGAAAPEASVSFRVQVLDVTAAGIGQLEAQLTDTGTAHDSARVTAFRPNADGAGLVAKLAEAHEAEVITAANLTSSPARPGWLRAGASSCPLRVEFVSQTGAGGKSSLHIRPQASWPQADGIETRTFEAEAPSGRDFVLSGFLSGNSDKTALERIFPGHAWTGSQLVILVTASGSHDLRAAALGRGR